VVGAGCLWVFYWRRRHRGADRYDPPEPRPAADRPLFVVAAVAAAGFAAAVLAGVPLEFAALAAAVVLVAAFAVRRRPELRPGLLPLRLLILVVGLFLVLGAADRTGFGDLLRTVVGTSGWRSAAAGAGLSDLVNNLPAYVALEPAVGPDRLLYLLAGTNLGPLALPWGSLATVIWLERVRAAGLPVDWRRFVATGTVTAALTLTATVAALAVT
jgi:arsenical pump membrane protein